MSSDTNGYSAGGDFPPSVDTIDKFPFATNVQSSLVGELLNPNFGPTGQSSTTHGYASGGLIPSPALTDTIQKFPFATDNVITDVGNLTVARRNLAGQQV